MTYARCLELSGDAHIELKQYEEAIVDFSNAIKISPLKSSILKQRASAYEKLGKRALAQRDLAAAKQIDNSY
jgi:Flp pilus assembly protein TadD